MRTVPAGRSRSSVSDASLSSISSNAGRSVSISRSPASVGDTLLVVRVSSRSPSFASSRRIEWLSADCEMPSFAAALVKLRSSATARNMARLPNSSRRI